MYPSDHQPSGHFNISKPLNMHMRINDISYLMHDNKVLTIHINNEYMAVNAAVTPYTLLPIPSIFELFNCIIMKLEPYPSGDFSIDGELFRLIPNHNKKRKRTIT